jgi:hypothetical protein
MFWYIIHKKWALNRDYFGRDDHRHFFSFVNFDSAL